MWPFCSLDTEQGVQNTSVVCIKSGQPRETLDYMSSTAAPHATMRQSYATWKNHGRFLLPIVDASSYRSGQTLHRSGVFWVQVLGLSASLLQPAHVHYQQDDTNGTTGT